MIVCLVLVPLVIFFAFARPWGQAADLWETAAAVRAVAQDFSHPDNPLLDLPGTTSPRFTPFTLFWGAVMKLGFDIFTMMAIAGIANFVLFVTGLFRFVSRISRSAILPAYMLPVMLIVWGTGYGQANAYQLRMFLETLPYVGMFTYGVCFHALAYLQKFFDFGNVRDAVLYGLLMCVAFVTHPITGAFGFVAALAMLIAARDWPRLVLMQAVPLAAIGAAIAWPYFDYWKVLTRGTGEAWFIAPMYRHQVEALGSALIGFPIAAYFAMKKRHLLIVYGLAMCLLIYVVSYFLQVLIGSRFLLYTTIFLHLAIATYLYEHSLHQRRSLNSWLSGHGYLMIIAFIVFVPGLWYRTHEVAMHLRRAYDPPLKFHAYRSPIQPFFFLSNHLDNTDIVMADDTTGWVIPAITGAKIVAQQKGDPLITAEINVRRQSARSFLYRPISTRERVAIVRRYRVTHILLDDGNVHRPDESLRRDLALIAAPIVKNGKIALYRISI